MGVNRRLSRRLFYLLISIVVATGLRGQGGVTMTAIHDVLYRADGTPANGTLLLSWPAFTTADNKPVAAGHLSVPIASDGTVDLALAPNAGATPSGTFYKVLIKSGAETSTEYWTVPAVQSTTIAAIRTNVVPSSVAMQMASREYVDSLLKSVPSDATVVHLSGTETIAGEKQFAIPPSVPSPVGGSDAVNKAYVDAVVVGVGDGNYVRKNGDVMTGPLTLSSDPTAPNQASNRHYVDAQVAALSGQISSGSSNATQIQGVPIDPAAPGDGQVVTFEASSGKYKPKPPSGGSYGNATQIQSVNVDTTPPTLGQSLIHDGSKYKPQDKGWKDARDYQFSQAPTSPTTLVAGDSTITLAPCPRGVNGSDGWHYLYISGTGTPEAALLKGGTCVSGASTGTVILTAAGSHASGYTISSASGGIQEASIDARIQPTNPSSSLQAGKVLVPPGEYNAYARVSIRAALQYVKFDGAIVNCYADDSCLFLGDVSNPLTFSNITIENFRGRPMVPNGTRPMIEDNSGNARILNTTARLPLTGNTFGYLIQVDNDQNAVIDGVDPSMANPIRCDASFCGAAIYAPGPFSSNAALGYVKNANLTMNCSGNGIDWQSGNTLRVSDSVIQGYVQFAVRAGTKRGGYGSYEFDNVYRERGNCINPPGSSADRLGAADIIMQGAKMQVHGGEGALSFPIFANTGSTAWNYYIVPVNTTYGWGVPLPVGMAYVNGSTPVTVYWPKVAGATAYDVLAVPQSATFPQSAPYGTGNYAIATNLSAGSVCSGSTCSTIDNFATRSSYFVNLGSWAAQYFPAVDLWPGGIVLSAASDSGQLDGLATYEGDQPSLPVVNVAPINRPSIFTPVESAPNAVAIGQVGGTYSPFRPLGANVAGEGAFLIEGKKFTDGGNGTNIKGKINALCQNSCTPPYDIFTWLDSNLAKTLTTDGNRPGADAGDTATGIDQQGGLAERAGTSISQYINSLPDNTNWKERLTNTLKSFKVPVDFGPNPLTGTEISAPSNRTGPSDFNLYVDSSTHQLTCKLGPSGTDCGPPGSGGTSGSVDWTNITNKPATFPPAPHVHPETDVAGLTADLAAKAAANNPQLSGDGQISNSFQVGSGTPIINFTFGTTVPTGTCTAGVYWRQASSNTTEEYGCVNGAWTKWH